MEFSGFAVLIAEGKEDAKGYVELQHKARYTLGLGNRTDHRCDARVVIDGKHVGTWRVNAHSEIRLERPANDTGHFTFYTLGTEEANQAGIVATDLLGLIKVTFTPEKIQKAEDHLDAPAFLRRREGGTGLSGQSRQTFTVAAPIELDEAARVTIHLRLVEADDTTPRPLKGMSLETPIPPRLFQ